MTAIAGNMISRDVELEVSGFANLRSSKKEGRQWEFIRWGVCDRINHAGESAGDVRPIQRIAFLTSHVVDITYRRHSEKNRVVSTFLALGGLSPTLRTRPAI